MNPFHIGARPFVCLLVAWLACAPGQVPATETRWVGPWSTAPRPVVHDSLGGDTRRRRFSNAFGPGALSLRGLHMALAAGPDVAELNFARP